MTSSAAAVYSPAGADAHYRAIVGRFADQYGKLLVFSDLIPFHRDAAGYHLRRAGDRAVVVFGGLMMCNVGRMIADGDDHQQRRARRAVRFSARSVGTTRGERSWRVFWRAHRLTMADGKLEHFGMAVGSRAGDAHQPMVADESHRRRITHGRSDQLGAAAEATPTLASRFSERATSAMSRPSSLCRNVGILAVIERINLEPELLVTGFVLM